MKSKRRKAKAPVPDGEPVASATECTGLMPALPESEAQAAREAALCDLPTAKGAGEE